MKKAKSKRKSNTYQETTDPGDFSFNITKVAVSQICKSVGFRHIKILPLETLTLITTKYLEALAKSAVSLSNAANRTQSNLTDLINALHDISLSGGFTGASTLHHNNCSLKSNLLQDLSGFVSSTEEIPFAKPIERPKEREIEAVKAYPGNLQRGAHIPKWLPAFPEVGSDQKCVKRANREELWEHSSLVLGCQNEGFQEKRNVSNSGKLAEERTKVSFRIIGGRKRVHLNSFSGHNGFSQAKNEDAEAEYRRG